MSQAQGLRLNVGSGQRRFEGPGWINLDVACRPPDQVPDVLADARGLPFPDATMALVLLNQVYEHFHLSEGRPVLLEAYRVLKPGGSLVLTVPDIRVLAQRWLTRQISDYIFAVNVYGAWQGLDGDDHHWLWSYETLREELMGCSPWSSVVKYNWRHKGVPKDFWILGVEAIK